MKRPEHRLATGLSLGDIDQVLRGLAAVIVPVDVRFLWRPQLGDPDDVMVLEAAINGRASHIVTFNSRDFHPADKFGIKVATPRRFVEELKA